MIPTPPPNDFDFRLLAFAAVMGALIGLGQLLNSDVKLTWRYALGRSIVSAGFACIAPVVLLWFPTMPPIAEFALAALFASMGTSGLQMLLTRVLGARE
jgi:Phage holin family 2